MGLIWEKVIRPVMFNVDAERAHEMGISAMRLGLSSLMGSAGLDKGRFGDIERFGLKFDNPVGVAAGFDKNGAVVNQLAELGFGSVEVGTVTYEPQSGNPKPRMFRLPQDGALINRLGFNNDGAVAISERLRKLDRQCIVGVNIGKNKNVPIEEATENYLQCFNLIRPLADYVSINISSPNTPHLRELQQRDHFEELIGALVSRNRDLDLSTDAGRTSSTGGTRVQVPLLVKIAPDLDEHEIEMIADICIEREIDGIIATNTTVSREGLRSSDVEKTGDGGLSGKPLAERSNQVIRTIYDRAKGRLRVVGVGGIFTAEDAFNKIAAGASLVQAYTGFVYGGPSFAADINNGLAALISDHGFTCLDDAVGSDAAV